MEGLAVKSLGKPKNWEPKAMKYAMVGYALDHTEDTYRLYNLETKRVVLSRDVRWAEWNKLKPTDRVSIFD